MIKYENQNNYANVPYPSPTLPNATIKSGGCGCVCSVNVLRFFGINVSVSDMAKTFISKGIRVIGGTDMNGAAKYLCNTYGLEYKTTTDENVLKQSLSDGCVAIANVDGDEGTKGIFSSAGHFINIVGYDNQPPRPFICFDVGYYNGKFNDSYRKQYVSISKDSYGNIIQFTSQDALNIDTARRNPQYWIFSKKGDNLTMTQYEELKQNINDLRESVNKLTDLLLPKYGYIDEYMPDWARPTITKLYRNGYIKGDQAGSLQLSYNDLRSFVVNDRAGLYGD